MVRLVLAMLLVPLVLAPTVSADHVLTSCSKVQWNPSPPPGWSLVCGEVDQYSHVVTDYTQCISGAVSTIIFRLVPCLPE